MKIIINSILTLLFAYSGYLILTIPQPYGIISMSILIITFLFNFVKNKKISIPFFILGIGGSLFILIAAYNFSSFTKEERTKFNIPTAVTFEKSDFESVLIKAKNENKFIFVDFYTGWCSPCLTFMKTVMTDKEVGKEMNQTFINVKYDAEKGEGAILSKNYKVKSYPTLLILDKNGTLIEEIKNNLQLTAKENMIRISKKYNITTN